MDRNRSWIGLHGHCDGQTVTLWRKGGFVWIDSFFSVVYAKDDQGTIWAGTYFGGVNYFNPEYAIYRFSGKGRSLLRG